MAPDQDLFTNFPRFGIVNPSAGHVQSTMKQYSQDEEICSPRPGYNRTELISPLIRGDMHHVVTRKKPAFHDFGTQNSRYAEVLVPMSRARRRGSSRGKRNLDTPANRNSDSQDPSPGPSDSTRPPSRQDSPSVRSAQAPPGWSVGRSYTAVSKRNDRGRWSMSCTPTSGRVRCRCAPRQPEPAQRTLPCLLPNEWWRDGFLSRRAFRFRENVLPDRTWSPS